VGLDVGLALNVGVAVAVWLAVGELVALSVSVGVADTLADGVAVNEFGASVLVAVPTNACWVGDAVNEPDCMVGVLDGVIEGVKDEVNSAITV
jgi:hypothetical protein